MTSTAAIKKATAIMMTLHHQPGEWFGSDYTGNQYCVCRACGEATNILVDGKDAQEPYGPAVERTCSGVPLND